MVQAVSTVTPMHLFSTICIPGGSSPIVFPATVKLPGILITITQIQAIVNNILENLSKIGIKPQSVEGHQMTRWILIDFGDVVVHVFDHEKRHFYELEKLWLDAPRIEPHLE